MSSEQKMKNMSNGVKRAQMRFASKKRTDIEVKRGILRKLRRIRRSNGIKAAHEWCDKNIIGGQVKIGRGKRTLRIVSIYKKDIDTALSAR